MGRNKDANKVKERVTPLSDEEKEALRIKNDEKKRRKALRNEVTHKLRFKILERDDYTCQYCGKSPKNAPGTQLEVDHIIPLDAGGDNDDKNLTTACWECNEGKKNIRLKAPTDPDREWKLNKEAIFEVAKSNDFDKFKKFLVDDKNEEERQWLYEYNYRAGKSYCLSNCEECTASGTWWFKGCIQKLNRAAHGSMDEALNVPREEEKKEEPTEALVPTNGGELVPTNGNDGIKIAGTKYEKLQCDFCYAALRCPKYKVGASCAFDWTADKDFSDPKTALEMLANAQGVRLMQGLFFEKLDGGAIDKNVSNEIMLFMRLLKDIQETGQPTAKISIIGEGTGKKGVGLVAQLVNQLFSAPPEKGEEVKPVTVNAEEVEFKDKEETSEEN